MMFLAFVIFFFLFCEYPFRFGGIICLRWESDKSPFEKINGKKLVFALFTTAEIFSI